MHADAHFVIGRAHVNAGKPCQDYATSGSLPSDGAYAVVSDGCSSGGATDVGSRVVALATATALRQAYLPGDNPDSWTATRLASAYQQVALGSAQAWLGCDQSDLLATAVYAVATPNERFALVQGDGVVAWQFADGTIMASRFEWDNNAPYYPAYAADSGAGFVSFHGGDMAAIRLKVDTWTLRPGQEPVIYGSSYWSVAAGMRGILWDLNDWRDVTKVAVFTDGVAQIDGLDWQTAVTELMGFKSMTGEFVKRRLGRFVRDGAKTQHLPIDDLAYAVIDLTPEEEL